MVPGFCMTKFSLRSSSCVRAALKDTSDDMVIKMQSPVVKIDPVLREWVCDVDDSCETSDGALPECVSPTREPTLVPGPHQREEGQPSPKLKQHMCDSGFYARTWTGSAQELMWTLFFFFLPYVVFFLLYYVVGFDCEMDESEGDRDVCQDHRDSKRQT